MLTIGLLQSFSMSSRWPPSISPEIENPLLLSSFLANIAKGFNGNINRSKLKDIYIYTHIHAHACVSAFKYLKHEKS